MMIRWCCFFLALLLRCSAARESPIDWSRCRSNMEMDCFLLDQCIEQVGRVDIIEPYDGAAELYDKKCKLGIQKRALSDQMTLYFVQVKSTLDEKKISFYHGDKAIVHCQKVDNGTIVIAAEDPSNGLDPKPYEDFTFFEADEALCAFTVKKMGQLAMTLAKTAAKCSVRFSEVKDSQIVPTKHEFKLDGTTLYNYEAARRRCDPELIQFEVPNEYRARPLRDKHRLSLNCKHVKAALGVEYEYELYVQKGSEAPEKWPELKCEDVDNNYYYTDGIRTNPNNILNEAFVAFCGVEINKFCDDPQVSGEGAPIYKPVTAATNPNLECPGGKWLIDGQYYTNIQAECQHRKNTANDTVFMFKLPDDNEKEWTNEKCFDKYDCTLMSTLDVTNECNEKSKEGSSCVVVSNEAIQCRNEKDDLRVVHGLAIRNSTQKFKCNPDTGLFVSVDGHTTDPTETIPIGARISCWEKPKNKVETGMSKGTLIAAYSGGAVLIALLLIAIGFCVMYGVAARAHLKATLVNRREIWRRMSSEKQLAEAQKVFGAASYAEPHSDVNILDGLKLLDAILATETDDPDIWKLINTFIYRLHLTTMNYQFPTGKLLGRYCYLQAKKIIDKHGWLSPQRITKAQPAGIIRAHAIRLLAIARRTDLDAQKMVLEGFKQLGWQAEAQYPHCGLLWSVIAQQRSGNVTQPIAFLRRLYEELDRDETIKEEERIAHFGGKLEQACFALAVADVAFPARICGKKSVYDSITDRNREIRNYDDKISELNRAKTDKEGNKIDKKGNKIKMPKITQQQRDYLLVESDRLQLSVLEGILQSGPVIYVAALHSRSMLDEVKDAAAVQNIVVPLIFRRMFKEAKNIETELYKRQAIDEMYDTYDKNRAIGKAAKKPTPEDKEKALNVAKKAEKKICFKVKADHQLYVDALAEEQKSIHSWLRHKIERAEADVGSDNKTQPNTQPNSTSLAVKSSQSTASAATRTAKGTEEKEKELADAFIESFNNKETKPRITTCPLSVEDQAKYRALLPLLMNEKKAYNARVKIAPELVIDILNAVTGIFESEPLFIEDVPAGITVVGDTHGQLYDFAAIFEANAKDGKPGYETTRYLFLGDYVDRGQQILETVMTLFILKLLYPDRFFLLRGNHEFINQNYQHLTLLDIEFRYEAVTAQTVYDKLNETFSYMSICAVIGGEIFCAHGGVSGSIITRNELRMIRKPICIDYEDLMLNDILWSDPHKVLEGLAHNTKRSTGTFYGREHLESSLKRLECTTLIRGHEVMKKGYAIVWPSCLTLFSATAVDYRWNDAAFVRISEDLKFEIVVLKCDKTREDVALRIYGKKEAEEVSRVDDAVLPPGEKKINPCAFGTGEVNDSEDDD